MLVTSTKRFDILHKVELLFTGSLAQLTKFQMLFARLSFTLNVPVVPTLRTTTESLLSKFLLVPEYFMVLNLVNPVEAHSSEQAEPC